MSTSLVLWQLITCVLPTQWRRTCRKTGASSMIYLLFTVYSAFEAFLAVTRRSYSSVWLLHYIKCHKSKWSSPKHQIHVRWALQHWKHEREKHHQPQHLGVKTVNVFSFIIIVKDCVQSLQGNNSVWQATFNLQRDAIEVAAWALHETGQHISSLPALWVSGLRTSSKNLSWTLQKHSCELCFKPKPYI